MQTKGLAMKKKSQNNFTQSNPRKKALHTAVIRLFSDIYEVFAETDNNCGLLSRN